MERFRQAKGAVKPNEGGRDSQRQPLGIERFREVKPNQLIPGTNIKKQESVGQAYLSTTKDLTANKEVTPFVRERSTSRYRFSRHEPSEDSQEANVAHSSSKREEISKRKRQADSKPWSRGRSQSIHHDKDEDTKIVTQHNPPAEHVSSQFAKISDFRGKYDVYNLEVYDKELIESCKHISSC